MTYFVSDMHTCMQFIMYICLPYIATDDYTSIDRELILTNDTTSQVIDIDIVDDDFIEPNEVFLVRLELLTPEPGITLSPNEARITIVSNDGKPCMYSVT